MDSNQRAASAILGSVISAQSGKLSLPELERDILAQLPAIDSTLPRAIRELLDGLVLSVFQAQTKNGAAALNTPRQFNYDENEGVDRLFDQAANALRAYLK
ncbi:MULTISPECIES: hypothetical protein [Bradyrhizobium]|jgi:hypothetical protein|uniref:hypothetical protein n=1 Tax=Bradyrhizobium TaxID=374 RepID=UPI0004834522|nr:MULTISPECIES: hypothetical protein [Bradyrhizobium]MCS3444823.1 hypothetical protein [Bradyrhizobium elkanii]MCS3564049.1 hypothetical protein [Bradyrhizobium elkanii]MCW2146119.1 hypothetical protein [Bradyrhizobium elkanii]MCW2354808.1 hypothetical protein [Bradyrhizobium elkanii]MCW2378946.1 hypothetical protein [Bradyrhizobium elkanii]